jgi:hypothetical protein
MAAILDTTGYKTLRGITTSERDAQITAALPIVEDAIARAIERDILEDPVTEERKFRYEGPIVNIDDCSSIASVKIDNRELTDFEDFVAEPQDHSQPFYWLDLGPYTGRPASPLMGFMRNEDVLGTGRPFRYVTITADWGWASKPQALKLAVALLVDEFATERAEHSGKSAEAVADTSVVWEAPESSNAPPSMPPAVENLIFPFRKIVL